MSTDRTTEILNYLSAMSREMGEFRQETNARLSGLESRMTGLEGRIESLETEMRAGFEQVRAEFEQVRADIRHLDRKMGFLNDAVLDLRAGQRGLDERVGALERKQT